MTHQQHQLVIIKIKGDTLAVTEEEEQKGVLLVLLPIPSNYIENPLMLIIIHGKYENTAKRNLPEAHRIKCLRIDFRRDTVVHCWGWAGWLKQVWIAAEIEGMLEGKKNCGKPTEF